MIKKSIFTCSILMLIIFAFGCSSINSNTSNKEIKHVISDAQYIKELSFDEVVNNSYNIITANLKQKEEYEDGVFIFTFAPIENIKGNIQEKEIHVYKADSSYLEIGKKYILFLEYTVTPFYPHTVYRLFYDSSICLKEDDTVDQLVLGDKIVSNHLVNIVDAKNNINKVNKNLVNKDKTQYTMEDKIISSENLNDVVTSSQYICFIQPKEITAENKYVKMANCRVTKKIKNNLDNDILVQLPSNIELDREYLVLLQEVDGGSFIISSKHSCIAKDDTKAMSIMEKALKDNCNC